MAGRLFLGVYVLLFAYSFAYLMRSIQGHPTAVEFIGLLWAYNLFMYAGYLSYLMSLPIAFFAVGKLYRVSTRNPQHFPHRDLVVLTVLGTATYLAHLFGWLIYVLAIGVFASMLLRTGRRRTGSQLLMTLAPSLLLLVWYSLGRTNTSSPFRIYQSLPNKVMSLVEPTFFFLRIDPFTSPFPVFWTNMLLLLMLAGLVIWNLKWGSERRIVAPLFLVGLLLMAGAVAIPFSYFGGLLRPDERLTLPSLLITVGALRFKAFNIRRGAAIVAMVIIVLGLHLVEFRQASQALEEVHQASLDRIPADAQVAWISVHEPPIYAACEPVPGGLTVGFPTVQWVGLYRLVETNGLRTNLFGTALVSANFEDSGNLDLSVMEVTPGKLSSETQVGVELARNYPFVQLVGCSENLQIAREVLAPYYSPIMRGEGFEILQRQE